MRDSSLQLAWTEGNALADIKQVAFLGAGGTMGLPMARNLAGAGFEVRAWNRSREKAEPLAGDGVSVADTAADAVSGSDAIITMLSDADAVADAVSDALGQASEGAIWVQTSTVGIEGCERLAELARQHGLIFVDAPVLGTKKPAEDAQLVVLASGPADARERVEPLFDTVGKKTMWVGEAGAGSSLKVVVNAWIVSVVEGAAETIALAEGLDLDPGMFLEAVSGGPLDLPYLQMKAKAMIDRQFDPSFSLALAAKDARLVQEAADRNGLDLPVLAAIRRRLGEGTEEHGDKDLAATFLTSAEPA
jgi:3-hydroxyisobutyrate dehydrogenase